MTDTIFNLISTIGEIGTFLIAVIALIISLDQVSSKTKVKLKIKKRFRLYRNSESDIKTEIVFYIVNLGLGTVYISECGIQFINNFKKYNIPTSERVIELLPGKPTEISCEFDINKMQEHHTSARHDRIRVYVKYNFDKTFFGQKMLYEDFKIRFDNCNSSIEENE